VPALTSSSRWIEGNAKFTIRDVVRDHELGKQAAISVQRWRPGLIVKRP
jgi:hypothetical protein